MASSNNKTVAVLGMWHLGMSVASCLADTGYRVAGLDADKKVISGLKRAVLPVFEPGIAELVEKYSKAGNLSFSSDMSRLKDAEYIILAQDTPVDDHDRVNTAPIDRDVAMVKKYIRPGATVIVMSQVPVGSCQKYYRQLTEGRAQDGIELVYNPENLRLGNAIKTFLHADRQVLGVCGEEGKRRMEAFYSFFKNPLLFMSLESAEMVKHGINAFLACSISFINQITDIAEAVGANMNDVVAGMKSDNRIGQQARIMPGLGFAGGTLGRDIQVLRSIAKKHRVAVPLIADIYDVNRQRVKSVYHKVKKIYPKLAGKKIALFGLVYKPGTSTLRRSLAMEVAAMLRKDGAHIAGYDPILKKNTHETSGLEIYRDPYKAVQGADIMIIVTEWPEFATLDYELVKTRMRAPIVYDPKNMLTKQTMINLGFMYYGTGI